MTRRLCWNDKPGLRIFPLFVYTCKPVWRCNDSPIGWCVYNHFDDPAHDNCVFCGEPEERK